MMLIFGSNDLGVQSSKHGEVLAGLRVGDLELDKPGLERRS